MSGLLIAEAVNRMPSNEPYRQPASIGRKIDSGKLRIAPQAELDAKIRRGDYQWHPFPLGCVITEIQQFSTERVLIVHYLFGERFDEWKGRLVDHLKRFASEHECHAIEANCRLGLEVALKPLGFKRVQVVLRSDV